MPVVQLYGDLRRGMDAFRLVVQGAIIQDVLEALCAIYPHMRAALYEQDHLRRYVRVMVNGHDVELAQGLKTPVAEGDQVSIFPPIAGGHA
jgi:sulfur-carrier protein